MQPLQIGAATYIEGTSATATELALPALPVLGLLGTVAKNSLLELAHTANIFASTIDTTAAMIYMTGIGEIVVDNSVQPARDGHTNHSLANGSGTKRIESGRVKKRGNLGEYRRRGGSLRRTGHGGRIPVQKNCTSAEIENCLIS